jgi:uncharacterized membrane protein YbhN (UPF0104 family)
MAVSKSTLRALRVLVAAALVGALIYAVDWRAIPGYVAGLDWHWAVLAVFALGSHFLISPWKWQWALRIHGLEFELPYLVRANGIGFFFNNFLPSAIGGDAYRIMSTWPAEGFRSRAISAVVIERVAGLLTLIAIGNVGAVLLFKEIPLVAISVLFQAVALLYIYALFQSLGSPVPLAACALIAAVSGLASILPISINGIGVVEGSFAGAAVALGADYEVALLVAVLIRLIVLPISLIFGAIYALYGSGLIEQPARVRPSHCGQPPPSAL